MDKIPTKLNYFRARQMQFTLQKLGIFKLFFLCVKRTWENVIEMYTIKCIY